MKIVHNFSLPYIFHFCRNGTSFFKFLNIKGREMTSALFKCQVRFLRKLRWRDTDSVAQNTHGVPKTARGCDRARGGGGARARPRESVGPSIDRIEEEEGAREFAQAS